ncbi:MAG: FimB/Mfa2 family fimbrial subunit [Prevotella sp.]|nr:FimB/Mfa2 family fimbrial subunit [Prevotella sp.]
MKKKIFSIVLATSGLFSGCSSEESVSRPETIGQTGTLTFSFPALRRSVTYAITDADATTGEDDGVDATADEALISDVTVYMFENSGSEFLVARQSATAGEGAGVQSVSIDVNDFTSNSADYVFYAVANVNDNIEDNFKVGITTLNDFTIAVAAKTGARIPGSNMLMVGYKTITGLSAETGQSHTINLRHRVARFDIDNTTEDDNPDNNDDESGTETFFKITKIHVFNTLAEGYLTEETNGRPTERDPLTVKADLAGEDAINVSGVDNINNGIAEGAFYLWPGVLAAKSTLDTPGSTVIKVEGVYVVDDTPIEPVVHTVQLTTGEQKIEANVRYTLKVSRIGGKSLRFDLVPSKWGYGPDVTATPSVGAFEYAGFELHVGGAAESTSLTNDNIDLSANTGDSELTFYTESDSRATGALTAKLDLTMGTIYTDSITIEAIGAPTVTYSGIKVRQGYKITLPKTTYPINGALTIKDEKTGHDKEFAITSVPVYEDTEYKPVPVKGDYSGSNPDEVRYWAPVNVGATSTTNSANLAGCGYYFQWGRSYTEFGTYNSMSDTFGGPVSAGEAETTYAGKFITNSSPETFYDWLSPQNPDLWNKGDRGPCPVGWRVPSERELLVLKNKYDTNYFDVGNDNRLRIPSDIPGEYLYLPAAGIRSNDGTWSLQNSHGYYWSSSVFENSARFWRFLNGSSGTGSVARATGYSVRCLQE